MNVDWLIGPPPPKSKLIESHTNKLVRERAIELEAYIVAWCRVTGLNPDELVLEQSYDHVRDCMVSRVAWRAP